MKTVFFTFFIVFALCYGCCAQKFKVSYKSNIFDKPFTGEVLLYLSKKSKTPKDGRPGLNEFPCFRIHVENIRPGEPVSFDDRAVSFPVPLSKIERGDYYVQVVWDRNLGERSIGGGAGNLYSLPQKFSINRKSDCFLIMATMMVPMIDFIPTNYMKEIKVPSALLSRFFKKHVTIDAAVHLPKEYFTATNRKFPVLFTVLGFGGDYKRYSKEQQASAPIDTAAFITVYLDGKSPFGHSVYANSDNNGPWGDALVHEFIPFLENLYRCNGARLLTGHSSGGWAALNLQTRYPETFHGCWSSSPDPVDFESFQKINLYKDKNMFLDADGSLRPTGTVAGFIPWFNMRTIYQMEHVIYRGEQMNSFNAVFSKKTADGSPEKICDPITGAIDPAVFEHWKSYDISRYLSTNWGQIKSSLDGKVRVTVGESDNFLLNHSVLLLDKTMQRLNGNFVFGYYPGDHFTVQTPQFLKDGEAFLIKKYLEWKTKEK